ncbi:uncharacterized protein PSFLO_00156 [Pseudozyma flocculosa]|uniref:Alpha-ketoglutarate-dependent dioxygenase AlkB-like domain-containing protein n=1 Tax=Pseudozyma flocculosa TaxID=84751 RepID=A0A5C3ESK5_9BASI|nr:uncharacterized protein PSFLO_00156 [Pseudozyma flocculosa]
MSSPTEKMSAAAVATLDGLVPPTVSAAESPGQRRTNSPASCHSSASSPTTTGSTRSTSEGSPSSAETDATSVSELASGPSNAPFVWSETRQELCESLPYYRAYQSGSYVKGISVGSRPSFKRDDALVVRDSFVVGYLLGGCPSRRDIWASDGRVIISHGGGKSANVDDHTAGGVDEDSSRPAASSSSKLQLKGDQEEDDSVIASLIQTMRMKVPLVLIAAENYALLPMKLNCSFAVLGWYIITDGWAEKEEDDDLLGGKSFVRWKFRFEWIQAQGEPWWCLGPELHRSATWNPRQRKERFTKAERDLPALAPHYQKASRRLKVTLGDTAKAFDEGVERPRKRLRRGPMKSTVALRSSVSTEDAFSASHPVCTHCQRASPIVFDDGWMCLAPKCPRFFSRRSPGPLRFSDDFLKVRGDKAHGGFPNGREPWSLVPEAPLGTSLDQARGLWCSKCGRLSCRAVINRPRCPHCDSQVGPKKGLPLVPAPKLSLHADADVAIVSPVSGIVTHVKREGGLVAYSFNFPKRMGGCAVHLVQADVEHGATEDTADRIFAGFQQGSWPQEDPDESRKKKKKGKKRKRASGSKMDIGFITDDQESGRSTLVPFRRHPLRSSSLKGAMLTQQFTVNYGMAYKHAVAMGTNPIDATTPRCVTSSMSLIRARTAAVCPLDDEGVHRSSSTSEAMQRGFNEAYGCLYLPFQSMSFHDDGEPGLGPIVSSLSLGAEATMKFRVKAKLLLDSPSSLSGGRGSREQAAARAMRQEMQTLNRDRTVLTLRLRHGSVCVQEGAELQKRFEHAVEPGGFRVACTTRFIDPDINGR